MKLRSTRRRTCLAVAFAATCLLCGPAAPLTAPKQVIRVDNPELVTLRKRAEKGDAEAQERLGVAYHFGQRGLLVDHALARRWLMRAAEAGRPYAARLLAELYRDGKGGPVDARRAEEFLRLAATKGHARSQAEIGYLHYKQDTPAERAEALKWINAAARQGDTYALSLLAYDYQYSPDRVERRRDRVVAYFMRGAQLGDVNALGRTAAVLYREDELDLQHVLGMLEEAGSRGHWPSALLLGFHYWDGNRASRDGKQAVKWLKLAAQNGSQAAELVLAQCHASGFGVRKNPVRAEELFAVAANVEPQFQNDFAWQLAVNPHPDVRDGARAVRIMETMLKRRENVTAARVDTLAAAYGEAGRFQEAVATQRRAISLLAQDPYLKSQPEELARSRKDFESRLAVYAAGKPFRENTFRENAVGEKK